MLDTQALGDKLHMTMEMRGEGVRQLARTWGVSAMTVVNARKGKGVSAEMLCRICIYTGDNPLFFWRDVGLDYGGLQQPQTPQNR